MIQQMMIIVPEQEINVEALQTKYPIIDWEIYTERARKYWKIIRVGNHTEVYQFFNDMLKAFDKEDLLKLLSLVKEKFTSTEPIEDIEREIWVELKRLFEPDTDDELWKLQNHIHDNLTWKLYDSCRVHHVSTEDGIDIYMLVEKGYSLSRGTLTLMLVVKLLVEHDSEMSRELHRKIFMQGEYDMWRLRIEQYFEVQDYALWDVIENGNSFKPADKTTTNADGTSTTLIPGPITTKEKVQNKNDIKARSMLLMKIVSQLAILGDNILQENLNLKFLISLPSEWNTHVVVWRNKPDLDTMSFDDLYNNFKIVKQEVKGTASSSSQNVAFVSSSSSTNEVNTAYGVSTANTQVSPANTQVSTASTKVSTANLSDDIVYAFLASQQNRGPRNQDSKNRNQDNSRRTINVEETSSRFMLANDGAGFDWSYMADDEVPTNMVLIAFSDSEEEMDLETAQTSTTAKLLVLKQGPVTTEEKAQKKNDGKAKSMFLMALPNEHLMTFNQYKDAKTLFTVIQTRFGGNDATKKTYKTILKQMCENFSAPSTESLDSIFNRLQKIRNKPDLDTMSFDDLYNNFKIVEQEVKETANSSSSLSSHNMAFVSSPSSTNEVNTAYGVSTAKTQVSLLVLKKITINGSDTAGYDKSKVECFNCHKMGHFARECRGPRNQDSRNKNQDSSRRTVNVEETSSKAMVAIDGAGFDWSYMADDEVPTNMALMAFSDYAIHNDKTCSKICLKSFEALKTQLDELRIEFNKSEFNLATYKRGLTSVEEQLVFYKKKEVVFCEQLDVLKRDISYKDSELNMLKSELEKLKQEKESNQLKIENFDNASKSLDKSIGSQIPNKSRKGMGFVSYNAIPPPLAGLFSHPNLDLSNSGLEEYQQPEFEGYEPKTSKNISEDTFNEVRESLDSPMVEKLVSDDKLEKKAVFFTVAKIEFVRPKQQEKPVRKPVKYVEMYRLTAITSKGKWWNMVPRAVLMKSGLRSLNTARPVTTAHPKTTVYSARPMSHFFKSTQSTVKSPYQTRTTLTNKNFSQQVNTAKGKFYTARPKIVNTARPNSTLVNDVRVNQVNAIKASACWV
ncbi:ribonuclease H-like domain-containing protein [Tanacetum coccineum]